MPFPSGGVVLVSEMISLHALDVLAALFWVSLSLRENGKHVVIFPSDKQEEVDIVVALF